MRSIFIDNTYGRGSNPAMPGIRGILLTSEANGVRSFVTLKKTIFNTPVVLGHVFPLEVMGNEYAVK